MGTRQSYEADKFDMNKRPDMYNARTSDYYAKYGGMPDRQISGTKIGTRVRPRAGPRSDMRFESTYDKVSL